MGSMVLWENGGPRRRSAVRPAIAMLILGALVSVIAAGLIAACGKEEATDTRGAAPAGVKTMLQNYLAAHNKADSAGLGAFYAEDAVVDDFIADPVTRTEGRDAIVDMATYWVSEGMTFQASGQPVTLGDYAVQNVRIVIAGTPRGEGVLVFELEDEGTIVHEWVSGAIRPE